jgi:hypothetical protein
MLRLAMRHLILVGILFSFSQTARCDPAPRQSTSDHWDAAYLDGTKSGYVHTQVVRSEKEGVPEFRTTVELSLTVRRFNDIARLRMITASTEAADGRVTGVQMRQFLGSKQQLVITGDVENNRLHVRVDGPQPYEKDIPWNPAVVGLYRQERLFQEHKVQPGDAFDYLTYEPVVVMVVRQHATVKGYEKVPGSNASERLLRAEVNADKIGGATLPTLVLWLDDERLPVVSEIEMPGLGKLRLYRTSKEEALRPPGATAPVKDIGFGQLIPISRRVRKPYDTSSALYRIVLKGDTDAGSAFKQDARQHVQSSQGDTVLLRVEAIRTPHVVDGAPKASSEFLESCYFINSDDALVRRHAAQAVGTEKDPWIKALRIERWVHEHMNSDPNSQKFSENFGTADHVARTLEGDCTEHALLAAAMCRAAGVPSRTAVGLIYVTGGHEPAFGFHMWTEVYVRGQWLPIDATLGRGYVGATHIKVLDHSWHDVHSMTPLLPLLRIVGKAKIEVMSVQ